MCFGRQFVMANRIGELCAQISAAAKHRARSQNSRGRPKLRYQFRKPNVACGSTTAEWAGTWGVGYLKTKRGYADGISEIEGSVVQIVALEIVQPRSD
jgi:hypothetical protein